MRFELCELDTHCRLRNYSQTNLTAAVPHLQLHNGVVAGPIFQIPCARTQTGSHPALWGSVGEENGGQSSGERRLRSLMFIRKRWHQRGGFPFVCFFFEEESFKKYLPQRIWVWNRLFGLGAGGLHPMEEDARTFGG